MSFRAPVQDIAFNIQHLSGWSDLTALPAYADFDLDDVQAILEEFGKFCSEEIAPLNKPGDEAGSHYANGKVTLPDGFDTAYAKCVEMGWPSLPHPAEFGGQGLPRVVGAAATEILNAANMSFALCQLLTDGAVEALLTAGSEQQKATYLEKLVSGEWTGTMNLTEPQAGSDLALLRTQAKPNDDGSYAISGTKIFITYGEHDMAENTIHLVLARLPDAPAGVKGISLFLVPKFMVGSDGAIGARNGVRCVSVEHKLGIKASPTAVLEFNEATGYLIGEAHAGLQYMFTMMNAARFAVGVQGIAISERAYQQALGYAQDRVQSRPVDGSAREAVPIIQHPDVRRLLMRMKSLTEGTRAMACQAAAWQDLGHHQGDKRASALSEFLTPLVKGYSTEMAVDVASCGVQIHGGMGFIEETGAAQHYRDARILPIYEGTTAIQANDLVGRKTLRDGGETALALATQIAETEAALNAGSGEARAVAARLTAARQTFETAVTYLTETAPKDPNAAYGAGVPFLMLAGNLVAGWQLARALLAAEANRDQDPHFMAQKIATARFYADHILPETQTQLTRITDGADSLAMAVFDA
ncbi:Acryloyl-CoA reductase (NADH) [Pelagimonas phthalicica]|uniref:3-methylmercaptopropionyl-CoA dehydrogenase n=1 Tax=Pelagimonas phthalicica TaxID=1037362 RepID=A0A238JIM1_9RHOB|nr:acyl-CoA dehydrogenase [Pelagimonas phthalicica]TDS89169.1 3-methylmercaptopropionyl-CoA dehydrogenase [Pelagimonas phthalicica]SMX29656.1 Acryloyl-CoA reductase (NADH) [Pelagimonas phthalicica]